MLKFKDFVGLRSDVKAVRERMARASEYRRFLDETLGRYGVKDVHDLDDAAYEKFMDEVKSYRKKNRMVSEGAVDEVTKELTDHRSRITQVVFDVVGDFDAYLESAGADFKMVVVPDAACDAETTKTLLQRRLLNGFSFGPLEVDVRSKDEWDGSGMTKYCGTVR